MGDVKSKLHDAVEREHKGDIAKLLDKHPELLNAAFSAESSMTPLTRLVWRGNHELVVWLVEERGADVNVKGSL